MSRSSVLHVPIQGPLPLTEDLLRNRHAAYEFDAGQVMAMAGISKRQIQWWDERGLVRPTHRAHRRYYTSTQAALVIVVAQLLHKGYTLQRCRKLLRALTQEIAAASASTSRAWLATDGRRVRFVDSLDLLADFQRAHPVTVVYLTPSLRMVGLER